MHINIAAAFLNTSPHTLTECIHLAHLLPKECIQRARSKALFASLSLFSTHHA